MRPVNKGTSPYTRIRNYQDAEPYLNKRIVRYCSFCEMPVFHVPEVEHKEGKASGGNLTEWTNLLYACKYCNTRKAQKIKAGETGKWLWPDKDNTFLAFTYIDGYPRVNENFLKSKGDDVYQKAIQLFEGVCLDFHPESVWDKDKRWQKRIDTLGQAEYSWKAWQKIKVTQFRKEYLDTIIIIAKDTGFFSIWMMVFKDDKEVRKALIDSFPGTAEDCFDEEGNPVLRMGGEI